MNKIDEIIKLLETDKDQAEEEIKFLGKQLEYLLKRLKDFQKSRLEMYESNKNIGDYSASLSYENAKEMLEFIIKGEE